VMSSQTRYSGTNNSSTTFRTVISDINAIVKNDKTQAINASTDESLKINVEPVAAKIEVTKAATPTIDPDGLDQFDSDITVEFVPKAVCLTGWSTSGNLMKQLATISTIPTEDPVKTWSGLVNNDTKLSGWVAKTTSTVEYHTINKMFESDGSLKSPLNYAGAWSDTMDQFFYPFENQTGDDMTSTNLVVLGKYVIKKNGSPIVNEGETFYLFAAGDTFRVFTEDQYEDLMKVMGGNADSVLEEDTQGETGVNKHLKWKGWMQIQGVESAFRCLKFNNGWGYYSHEILRDTSKKLSAIVRNTWYKLNITTIKGMGIGIPTDDTEIIPIPQPDPSNQNYYMHVGIAVQPWVELSSYNVEWGAE
ncbi:MAG: fimbria major subunit, partial [Muribaculaceae bacterium]|nr:fimbria major subunit [Muribaculaceae bacterium]